MTTTNATLTDVTIRDATIDDTEFLAWVMLAAGRSHLARGIWDYMLDRDEEFVLAFLRRLATTDVEHFFHWSQFVIAEVGGQPAAALCGYDPTTHGMEPYLAAAMQVTADLLSPEEIAAMAPRGVLLQSVFSEPPEGVWIVENVATAPSFRRRGLVDQLLSVILERGKSAGYACSQISLFVDNAPARAAYAKRGFIHADEKRSAEFEAALGSPGVERMLQDL